MSRGSAPILIICVSYLDESISGFAAFLDIFKRSSDSIVFLRERLACSHDNHVAMRKWTAFGFGRRSSPGQRGTQVPGRLSMALAYTN
jgi:hypothetical protein